MTTPLPSNSTRRPFVVEAYRLGKHDNFGLASDSYTNGVVEAYRLGKHDNF